MKKLSSFNTKLLEETTFRYYYVFSLLLSSLCFIESICLVFSYINMIWAFYFFIKRISTFSSIKQIRSYAPLFLFILLGILTSLWNHREHFSSNILLLYHATICFTLLYGMHATQSKEANKQEIFKLFQDMTKIINLLAITGLLFFVLFVRMDIKTITIGLLDNRYTGFYTHPNIAAFVSVIGIIGNHFLYGTQKNVASNDSCHKVFYLVAIMSHMITIWLSDSNASFVYVCIYIFIHLCIKSNIFSKCTLKKAFLVCGISTMAILCSYSLRCICQNYTVSFIESLHTATPVLKETDASITCEPITTLEIGRSNQKDLSSGRLDSLQKALLLFELHPYIGIGKANILPYGEKYLTEGFLFFDLHNGYLTILVSCGLIGFLCFVLFLLELLRRTYHLLQNFENIDTQDAHYFSVFIPALLGYGIYALFERTILFDFTFMVIIFWVMLGHFMSYAVTYETSTYKQPAILLQFTSSVKAVQRFLFRS